MKKIFTVLFLFCNFSKFSISAQDIESSKKVYASSRSTFSGFRLGLSNVNYSGKNQKIYSNTLTKDDSMNLRFKNPGLDLELGGFVRFPSDELFFQFEGYYTFTSLKYEVDYINPSVSIYNKAYTKSLHQLTVPVSMGFRILRLINVHAGAGASIVLNPPKDNSGKKSIPERMLDSGNLFYFMGTGVDIWRLSIDVNYQHTFTDLYFPIVADDTKQYEFRTPIQRMQLKIGFILGKPKDE